MPSQSGAKRETLESLAESFASIAESFREYVALYRANSEREAGKDRRPRVVSVSRATYQREENPETAPEVPGFRRGLDQKTIESLRKKSPGTNQAQ